MKVVPLLFSLKIFYSVLVLIVLSLMAFYVRGVTSNRKVRGGMKALFYAWIGFLVFIAIMFHVFTAWNIPWVHWEINRDQMAHQQEISILAKEHQFILPQKVIKIKSGEIIRFKVRSEDLTYGFGVFRENGGMEFQMQVIPGHSNDIIWIFSDTGRHSIRSTEYAGIATEKMYLKNAIEVY